MVGDLASRHRAEGEGNDVCVRGAGRTFATCCWADSVPPLCIVLSIPVYEIVPAPALVAERSQPIETARLLHRVTESKRVSVTIYGICCNLTSAMSSSRHQGTLRFNSVRDRKKHRGRGSWFKHPARGCPEAEKPLSFLDPRRTHGR